MGVTNYLLSEMILQAVDISCQEFSNVWSFTQMDGKIGISEMF